MLCLSLLLVLVAFAAPTKAQDTTNSSPTSKVLVIGDSLASGQGIYKTFEEYPEDELSGLDEFQGVTYSFGSSDCWRDDTYIPGALLSRDTNDAPLHVLACAGAYTWQVVEQWDYARVKYGVEDSIALLTFGANDVLALADGLLSLRTVLKCGKGAIFPPWILPVNTDTLSDWSAIEERVEEVIAHIANTAPASTRIRVVGSPLQFRPYFGFLCLSPLFICANAFDAVVGRLNGIIQAATERYSTETEADLQFVDIDSNVYLRSAACSLTKKDIRGITFSLPGIVSFSSFHPTIQGYSEVYEMVARSL